MPNAAGPFSRAHRGKRTLTVLPAAGCTLAVPKMPRGREWTAEERALWHELWRLPQATMWDDSYAASISMYIASVSAVLAGTAAGWQAAEARQLGDRLGLTPEGLRALGWIIEGDAEAGAVTPLRAS
jgi:hypothetical protein